MEPPAIGYFPDFPPDSDEDAGHDDDDSAVGVDGDGLPAILDEWGLPDFPPPEEYETCATVLEGDGAGPWMYIVEPPEMGYLLDLLPKWDGDSADGVLYPSSVRTVAMSSPSSGKVSTRSPSVSGTG